MPPSDAVAHIAAMIDQLDMQSESYETDVAVLLGIGATIWDMASGPGGAADSGWVPPLLRP